MKKGCDIMLEDINAIKDFEFFINYQKESSIIELHVKATASEETIYEENTICRFYYEAGYGQQVVEIDWNVNNTAMKALGLHSRYTSNFQRFEFVKNNLIIHSDGIKVFIKKI